ncbi:Rmi1p Ecym_1401 [Eremothecium cymbalariae DBVPG|uniref:RecQ mediated genome instability protein 1 OB-fold domain-containing protein n=1 Tax=Eremothecium cymbalariae (strain CBS 270.75 / DBVPG 7215 / KCTC 17166 / NRRL Y-17582) TaxID=931890 RepID=G8JM59_ERECY|nr:hypothetical protein Ecym_1401 [Eremothecium cymbalariae DBVPG\
MTGTGILSSDITDDGIGWFGQGVTGSLLREAYDNEPWDSVKVQEQRCKAVDRKLLFQICMVENVTKSKLAQVDEYGVRLNPRKQMVDRMGSAKHQDLVTSVDVDADDDNNGDRGTGMKSNGDGGCSPLATANESYHVYKLTVQDKTGQLFYLMNLEPIAAFKAAMLGGKLIVLPGGIFNRGVFLVTNSTVQMIFGLIPSWNSNREQKLCAYLEYKLEEEREMQSTPGRKRSRK